MRICFAGTPEFAVPALAALLDSRHEVALVITQPDRPSGRHRHLMPPPVKRLALQHNIPVIQPLSPNRGAGFDAYSASAPDALVVVAYGNILSRKMLAVPRLGCYNIHASLLPRLRGAAPITQAILNGDKITGVTIQKVVFELDAGPVVAQKAVQIGPDETSGELSDRLARLGADMLLPALDAVEAGTARLVQQDETQATYAAKLAKNDGLLRWETDSVTLSNFVRGMTPWPGAYTFMRKASSGKDMRVIVLSATPVDFDGEDASPGQIVRAEKELFVAAGRGCVSITAVKPEGGHAMDAAAFLRGHAVKIGDRFHAG